MEYRLAREEDIHRLAALRWEFKISEGEPSTSNKQDFITHCARFLKDQLSQNWFCWIAVDEGTIASHIFIEKVSKIPSPSQLNGAWGYVTNVYTLPQYRNQGIGSALMQKVKTWSTEQDFELLIVWPSDQSIPFYERAGFKDKNDIMELLF